jgi:hypothetical protein
MHDIQDGSREDITDRTTPSALLDLPRRERRTFLKQMLPAVR